MLMHATFANISTVSVNYDLGSDFKICGIVLRLGGVGPHYVIVIYH